MMLLKVLYIYYIPTFDKMKYRQIYETYEMTIEIL